MRLALGVLLAGLLAGIGAAAVAICIAQGLTKEAVLLAAMALYGWVLVAEGVES